MAIRKKETTITVTPIFEETKKVLKSILEKESEVRAGHSNQVYSNKKAEILKALDEVDTVSEQVELENQLKQIEIDRRKDFERAYFASHLSEEDAKKVRENYRIELQEANKRLEIAHQKYQEVKFDVHPSISALEELLTIYNNLAYVREIEYRLDKQKEAERKRYLDVTKHSPYEAKISYIKASIEAAKSYIKKQQYLERKFSNIS